MCALPLASNFPSLSLLPLWRDDDDVFTSYSLPPSDQQLASL